MSTRRPSESTRRGRVEASVDEILQRTAAEEGVDDDATRELARARELVGRAEEALAELK